MTPREAFEYRVLSAAERCEPEDERQAALIGGIVRCLIDTGHFLPQHVASNAIDLMVWALRIAKNMDATYGATEGDFGDFGERIFPQRGHPTPPEVKVAVEMYFAQYDPPTIAA